MSYRVQVTFRDMIRYRHDKQLFIAAEGVYSGQVSGVAGCTYVYI